jgi:hypothetical protein
MPECSVACHDSRLVCPDSWCDIHPWQGTFRDLLLSCPSGSLQQARSPAYTEVSLFCLP